MTLTPVAGAAIVIVFVSVFVVLWGAGEARAQPRMPTHVACVGDSITAGVGSTGGLGNSYPGQLQALLGDHRCRSGHGDRAQSRRWNVPRWLVERLRLPRRDCPSA